VYYSGTDRTESFARPDGSPGVIQVGTLTFAAGSDTATLTLHAVSDRVAEGLLNNSKFDFVTFSFGIYPSTTEIYVTDLAQSNMSVAIYDSPG
jgi:hypothetical protein